MQLLIEQRVFSWSDTYDIYDEQGNQKYFVKNELISLGHRLHVYDAAHNEIGFIKQKLFCEQFAASMASSSNNAGIYCAGEQPDL